MSYDHLEVLYINSGREVEKIFHRTTPFFPTPLFLPLKHNPEPEHTVMLGSNKSSNNDENNSKNIGAIIKGLPLAKCERTQASK